MVYKKALDVLMGLLRKYPFSAKEKGAVLTAIGVLGWAAIGKRRMVKIIKDKKLKRDKSTKW